MQYLWSTDWLCYLFTQCLTQFLSGAPVCYYSTYYVLACKTPIYLRLCLGIHLHFLVALDELWLLLNSSYGKLLPCDIDHSDQAYTCSGRSNIPAEFVFVFTNRKIHLQNKRYSGRPVVWITFSWKYPSENWMDPADPVPYAVLVSRLKPNNFYGSKKPQWMLMRSGVEMQPSITT